MEHVFIRKNVAGYFYGATAPKADSAGVLYLLSIEGEGIIPEFPHSPASDATHRLWLTSLEEGGFRVWFDIVSQSV